MSPPESGPDPRSAARAEFLRALSALGLAPLRLVQFGLGKEAHCRALARALKEPTPEPTQTPELELPGRPLRILISCGEASSAGHAARLARALFELAREAGAPAPELFGLGPATLEAAGVECLADPSARATMGAQGVSREIPFYLDLLETGARAMRERAPDVFAPVDAPALHLPMAHMARKYGVPSVHLVAPQYWAWGPWRAHAYRRDVDLALTIFPWEPAWFKHRGIQSAHVGHPQLDELNELPAAPPPAGRTTLALLPGSRRTEIEQHLPWMLRASQPLVDEVPGLQVQVIQARDQYADSIRAALASSKVRAKLVLGDPHRALATARAALAVSGTVLTDLLHQRLPAVVVYSVAGRLRSRVLRWMLTTPYFSSTNLLAGREVLPERGFRSGSDGPLAEVGELLKRCYKDEAWRAQCLEGLELAAERMGPPGVSRRAAAHILAMSSAKQ